jgi:hypothetical protein
MPHSATTTTQGSRRGRIKAGRDRQSKTESRYTVGLAPGLAYQVEQYAEAVDTSMSKAIATLVRLGLENQAIRKREFFTRLKKNLANNDSKQQDRLIDEFRTLILGR